MPEGTSIEATTAAAIKVEGWVRQQHESKIVTTYIGQGAPRFFFSYNPELPDPAFAKLVILTPDARARDRLKLRLRERIAQGLVPEARVRVSQLIFGPYPRYLVNFRVMGPDLNQLRTIANQVQAVMRANPHTRQVNQDSGERTPTVHFVLDQDRLQLMGLSSSDAAEQLQFLLTGAPVTQVRDEIRPEDPILRRRDRTPTITVQSDFDEAMQPPEVSMEIEKALAPLIARLPSGYRIETGGNIEDSSKANSALLPVFPIMLLLTLLVLVLQTRSLSAMTMVFLTSPLGVVGAVPILLILHQPFGFNAILGLIGLSGILMRNTLILIGQIHSNEAQGLDPYHAVVEATVQRARPVLLTALAAVLAFSQLSTSVFGGSMACTLIGGTAAGTVLTLVFYPRYLPSGS